MFRLRQLVQRHKKLFTASVRGMSANNFSGEVTELYTILSKQHTHENGPWNKMIAAASAGLPGGKGTVLDVASGPGEPGLSIAKILPGKEFYSHAPCFHLFILLLTRLVGAVPCM
jgi:hypothetical protein